MPLGADQARAVQRVPAAASDHRAAQVPPERSPPSDASALLAADHAAKRFRAAGRQSHLDKPATLGRVVQRQSVQRRRILIVVAPQSSAGMLGPHE